MSSLHFEGVRHCPPRPEPQQQGRAPPSLPSPTPTSWERLSSLQADWRSFEEFCLCTPACREGRGRGSQGSGTGVPGASSLQCWFKPQCGPPDRSALGQSPPFSEPRPVISPRPTRHGGQHLPCAVELRVEGKGHLQYLAHRTPHSCSLGKGSQGLRLVRVCGTGLGTPGKLTFSPRTPQLPLAARPPGGSVSQSKGTEFAAQRPGFES